MKNHQNCNCIFVSEVKVEVKSNIYPAQIWKNPDGLSYCRVFYDTSNEKLYWRYGISDVKIL